ncbi:MAG: hypothetical protein AAF725_18975 [Acidobacteriota bacterium]
MRKDQMEEGVGRLLREIKTAEARGEFHEEDVDLKRWEALSFGTQSEDDARELMAEAAGSAEAARRYEAYRPLAAGVQESLLERVQQELQRPPHLRVVEPQGESEKDGHDNDNRGESEDGSAGHEAPETPSDASHRDALKTQDADERDADERDAEDDAEKVVPIPAPAKERTPWWLAPSVAALAATLLWAVLWPLQATLPDYELSATRTTRTLRAPGSAVDSLLVLKPGDGFEIALRPSTAVEHRLSTAVYARRGERLEAVELETEISESGSVRIQGRFDEALTAGEKEVDLWIVVAAASESSLPSAAELLAHRGAGHQEGWRLLRCRLQTGPESEL